MIIKYPKIQTLWKRDNKTHLIQEGDYSKEEFENIDKWQVTEKVDGTNIRVVWCEDDPVVSLYGRTDNATIPKNLLLALNKTFKQDKLDEVFRDKAHLVILYGEGYGNKIQSIGKHYRRDNGFIFKVSK